MTASRTRRAPRPKFNPQDSSKLARQRAPSVSPQDAAKLEAKIRQQIQGITPVIKSIPPIRQPQEAPEVGDIIIIPRFHNLWAGRITDILLPNVVYASGARDCRQVFVHTAICVLKEKEVVSMLGIETDFKIRGHISEDSIEKLTQSIVRWARQAVDSKKTELVAATYPFGSGLNWFSLQEAKVILFPARREKAYLAATYAALCQEPLFEILSGFSCMSLEPSEVERRRKQNEAVANESQCRAFAGHMAHLNHPEEKEEALVNLTGREFEIYKSVLLEEFHQPPYYLKNKDWFFQLMRPTKFLGLASKEEILKSLGLSYDKTFVGWSKRFSRSKLQPNFHPHTDTSFQEEREAIMRSRSNGTSDFEYSHHSSIAYAIDSEDTKEVDDAISLSHDAQGREWIHVHIADPAEAILPGSALANDVLHRSESIYLVTGVVRMLPDDTTEALTLKNGTNRSFTVSYRFDEEANVVDFEISHKQIEMKRLTYDAVDRILSSPESVTTGAEELTSEECRVIRRMNELAQLRPQKITFRLPDSVDVFVEAPNSELEYVHVTKTVKDTPARNLVAELMIGANRAMAMHGSHNNIPLCFRGQPEPVFPEGFNEFSHELSGPYADSVKFLRQISFIKPAFSSASPVFHFSLGVDHYARSTSPLRRSEDFISHWQTKEFLKRGSKALFPYSVDELQAHLPYLDHKNREIRSSTRGLQKVYLRQKLLENIGRDFECVVVDISQTYTEISYNFDREREERGTARFVSFYIPEYELSMGKNVQGDYFDDWKIGDVKAITVSTDEVKGFPVFDFLPERIDAFLAGASVTQVEE